MEAVNNNSSMVMTGMRVQVGTQAIERAPSYVEVFGRTMQINLTRARWFDFPFTREEALQADKKLSIFSKRNDTFLWGGGGVIKFRGFNKPSNNVFCTSVQIS